MRKRRPLEHEAQVEKGGGCETFRLCRCHSKVSTEQREEQQECERISQFPSDLTSKKKRKAVSRVHRSLDQQSRAIFLSFFLSSIFIFISSPCKQSFSFTQEAASTSIFIFDSRSSSIRHTSYPTIPSLLLSFPSLRFHVPRSLGIDTRSFYITPSRSIDELRRYSAESTDLPVSLSSTEPL